MGQLDSRPCTAPHRAQSFRGSLVSSRGRSNTAGKICCRVAFIVPTPDVVGRFLSPKSGAFTPTLTLYGSKE